MDMRHNSQQELVTVSAMLLTRYGLEQVVCLASRIGLVGSSDLLIDAQSILDIWQLRHSS